LQRWFATFVEALADRARRGNWLLTL